MRGTWPRPSSAISRSSHPSTFPSIDPSSTPSFTSSRPLPPTRSTRSSPSSTFRPAISSKPQPENPLSGLITSVFALLANNELIGRKQSARGIKAANNEGLIENLTDAEDAVSMHVLVSRTTRFHAEKPQPQLREAAVAVLIKRLAKADDIHSHPDLLALVPHVSTLTENLPDVSTSKLLFWLGHFNYLRGAYAEAEIQHRKTFECFKKLQGVEHSATLTSMSNLAGALMAQGDYAGAQAIEEEALAVRRRVLGAEHPDTLASMGNLAQTLMVQGDYAGARTIEEEVLAVRRRVLNRVYFEKRSFSSSGSR